jgi:hypothetical protein
MHTTGITKAPRAVASFVSWHRRAVGALLAALAVLLLAESLATPPPAAPAAAAECAFGADEPLTVAKGRAVVPIVVADGELRRLLSPGDLISLVSAHGESPGVVTGDARVLALPAAEGSGALRVSASAEHGALLVDVPASSAALFALLGQGGQLGVVLGSVDG